MKKIAIISLIVAGSLSAYSQGYVSFGTTASASTKIQTNSVQGGGASGYTLPFDGTIGATYYYGLFYSPTATLVSGSSAAVTGIGNYAFGDANWTFAGYGTNTASAGKFSGSSAGITLPTGANEQFVIVGWSANIGSTVSALSSWYMSGSPLTAGWIGESAVSGTITPGNGALIPTPAVMGAASPYIQGFTLGLVNASAVPEPGTLALAAMGGASLLLFRRRK